MTVTELSTIVKEWVSEGVPRIFRKNKGDMYATEWKAGTDCILFSYKAAVYSKEVELNSSSTG